MKNCPYCKTQFTPHPKVGERQITCGKPACKAALKSDNNRKWRQRNPDYHRDYPRVKDCLEQKPGYLKKYRETHPEYVEKNREAQRVSTPFFPRFEAYSIFLSVAVMWAIIPYEIFRGLKKTSSCPSFSPPIK